MFSLIQVLFICRQNCNPVLLRVLVCFLSPSKKKCWVFPLYRCTIFRRYVKISGLAHRPKSNTSNQNCYDIWHKYYMTYKQHIEVKENWKENNYASQKDTESFQSQRIFSCRRDPFTAWVSNFTSVRLLLLVAIISSQGFNLREEDHSKDGKPFAIHRKS